MIFNKGCYDKLNFNQVRMSFKNSLDFGVLNCIEEQAYSRLSQTERKERILLYFTLISGQLVNEFVEIQIGNLGNRWFVYPLSRIYNINIPLHLNDAEVKRILPKTKDVVLARKIIKNNIIISTLTRCSDIILYSRTSKNFSLEESIYKEIGFTKGYVICVKPNLFNTLKSLVYTRKIYHKNPVRLEVIAEAKCTVYKALSNDTYNGNVWIGGDLSRFLDNKNSFLAQEFNTDKLLNVLNTLNYTPLTYNSELFGRVFKASIASLKLVSGQNQNILNEKIVDFTKEGDTLVFDEDDINLNVQSDANKASILALIKKQFSRITQDDKGVFYLKYIYDRRTRVYVENWPLNYQLNHVVRSVICIAKSENLVLPYQRLLSHELYKKNYVPSKFLLVYKIGILDEVQVFLRRNKVSINIAFLLQRGWGCLYSIEGLIKLEVILNNLIKLAPKDQANLDKRLALAMTLCNQFLKDNLLNCSDFWLKKLNWGKADLVYLFKLQDDLTLVLSGNYDSTCWSDASNNAMQLITFRLKNWNKDLLKLINISENDGKFHNIYHYVSAKITELDHSELLKKLDYVLSQDDVNSFNTPEDTKYRIMPASYGMTLYGNFEKTNQKMITSNRVAAWSKLTRKQQILVASYLWTLTQKTLVNLGFDIEKFKSLSQSHPYDSYWWSDYGLPIVPIVEKTSNRQAILKSINRFEWSLKNTLDEVGAELLKVKITRLKTKLLKDDKDFWKRTRVKVKDKVYTLRIPASTVELNKVKMKMALTPNSIHSYDASILIKVVEVCKDLGVNVLVVHDALGCQQKHAPLVNLVFRLVNIYFLKQNDEKPTFPYINEEHRVTNKVILDILESTKFFR